VSKQRAKIQEIFLSHSSKNRPAATRLANVLRGHGLSVWYSKTHIAGAQEWHDEIGKALDRCGWFVVLLSKHSVRSDWVKRELLYALRQKRYGKRIVPVLLEPCEIEKLSWTLASSQIVDFSRSSSEGYRELLRVWGLSYNSKRRG
jgi:hypothetical protein